MQTILAEARRMTRFGIVGVTATLTHLAVAYAVLAWLTEVPYVATFSGFPAAFCVSYLGHYHFTFGKTDGHQKTLPRFFTIAVSGFLGSLMVLKLVDAYGGLTTAISMTVSILVIPGLTYLSSRLWAFR